MGSKWAILSLLHMVMYVSRQLEVSWFSTKTKWTFVSSSVTPIPWACHLNSRADSLVKVPNCHIVAMPKCKLNLSHWSRFQTYLITYPQVVLL